MTSAKPKKPLLDVVPEAPKAPQQVPEPEPEAPVLEAPPQAPPDLGQPALPQSVLGTDVPAGQPIPPERMKQAEKLATNPQAEAEFRGKQDFHNTLRDFGDKEAANRASMLALNPNDPDYLKKLAAHQAEQGLLRAGKAHYEQAHPWGSAESAHPGFWGKVGHAFGNIANVAGEALAPSLTAAIPGSKLNLQAQEAAGKAEQELGAKEAGQAATTEATEAEVPLRAAQTKEAEANAAAKGEEKIGTTPEAVTLHDLMAGENGQPRINPKTKAPYTYLDAYNEVAQARAGAKPAKPDTIDQQYQDALESGDHEKAERLLKVKADLAKAGQAPQRPPQTTVILPGGEVALAKPGTVLPKGTQTPAGYGTEGRLTNATRTMVEAAPKVKGFIKRIEPLIADLEKSGSLGPGAGRWNEFWTGRVGADNPQFTRLRTDVGLLTTLLMRMHVGARGGEYIMQHFSDIINSGKQSPNNMRAALEEIGSYADDLEHEGQFGEEGTNTTAPSRPANVPADYVFNENGPKGRGWYKPQGASK